MATRPVCLITGASTGIGAACARMAAQRGYDMVLGYHSDRSGADAVAAAAEQLGARAVVQQGDVSDPAAIDALYARLDSEFSRLDALINNAGIVAQTARLTDMDFDRLSRMFATNVVGAMLVAKAAVSRMEAQGDGGVIINVGSAAARLGSGGQYVDYAASKGAIDTFTKGLADEVAAQNIRVMCVRPGIIDTPIHGKGGEPDRADRLAHLVPLKRKGSAEEVAQSILWLMSDEASYVTGSSLDVTGGR
ncbi:MAG: SDR family oxidoreductase [Paracoccaceae bacterium]